MIADGLLEPAPGQDPSLPFNETKFRLTLKGRLSYAFDRLPGNLEKRQQQQ